MNAHVPQSITTANEIWEIARVSTQIVTPQTNGPIIGVVQDSLLGSYLLTLNSTQLTLKQVSDILIMNNLFDGKLPERKDSSQKYWSGRQLISTILPPINLKRFSNTHKDDFETTDRDYLMNHEIVIKNGELVSGAIDKSILGSKRAGSIAHVTYVDHGPEYAKNFLNLIQKYTNKYLQYRGFSMGVRDIVVTKEITNQVNDKLLLAMAKLDEIIQQIDSGTYIPPPDITTQEFYEIESIQNLNNLLSQVGSVVIDKLNPETNALLAMITSGSKGEKINIAQIMGAVGQQNVDRKRIGELYGTHRTLPHFHKYNTTVEARGFIQHSFLQGLNPKESFFHAMAGREGIIDTSIRTADAGYISRKLMKAMEDIMISYDNTVRNANNQVIQLIYGGDGIDPTFIEKQRIESLFMNNQEILNSYEFENKESLVKQGYLPKLVVNEMFTTNGKLLLDSEIKQIFADRDYVRGIIFTYSTDIDDKFNLPVNIRRIIVNAINQFTNSKEKTSTLNPLEIIKSVNLLNEKISKLFVNQTRFEDLANLPKSYSYAVSLFQILVRSSLASKRVIKEYKFNKAAFDYTINEIETRFLAAIVQPGEMVGAIASQSLGEPSTQLTLNTFHFTGIGEKSNVTAGVPRLNELINVSRRQKNPYLLIYLDPAIQTNKLSVETVRNELRNTMLNEFVNKMQILYDPDLQHSIIPEDQSIINDFFNYSIDPQPVPIFSNWTTRLTLNKNKMLYNQMHINYIKEKLEENPELYVISSDDNAPELILRIYFVINNMPDKNKNNSTQVVDYSKDLLDKMVLRGVPKLNKIDIREDTMAKSIDPLTGDINKAPIFYLDTDGVNLREVLNHPKVDIRRTISVDINEVFDVFGIEAARTVLCGQIKDVLISNGIYINSHHMELLVETMCFNGKLTAVSRHGFNRLDKSPVAKMSFEETMEQLKNAGLYYEEDNMRGVSTRVIFTQTIKGGCGVSDIVIDDSIYGVKDSSIDDIMGAF